MSRIVNVAAAQLGPIQRADSRADVMERLLAHLHNAHAMGCQLVVFQRAGPTRANSPVVRFLGTTNHT
mgnify:CR=1 FL=1